MPPKIDNHTFAHRLLDWFDLHGRKELPWQIKKCEYTVWLSEIMLQQTQVNTVIPYFNRFISRFPTLDLLAASDREDVLHLWSGLGYYSRARNLHRTAVIIQTEHQGIFPDSLETLIQLPGIGRSTAGAVLSLASKQRHPILDGNVKRILCRYFRVEEWPGTAAIINRLWEYAEHVTPLGRCDDFNQAMMDLGSSICSRTKPQCDQCPLNFGCIAYKENTTHLYPRPKPSKALPERQSYFLMLITERGEILLEKQGEKGIWGGLWAFPQIASSSELFQWLIDHHLGGGRDVTYWSSFRHTFSHFHLQIKPIQIDVDQLAIPFDSGKFIWHPLSNELSIGTPAPIQKMLQELIVKRSF